MIRNTGRNEELISELEQIARKLKTQLDDINQLMDTLNKPLDSFIQPAAPENAQVA